MATFLKELKEFVDKSNESYFNCKVEEIKDDIRARALEGYSSLEVAFFWEDGYYQEIIKYFEAEGLEVGAPSGPNRGEYTSYIFKWEI